VKQCSKDFFEEAGQFCYVSKTPFLRSAKEAKNRNPFCKGALDTYLWLEEKCYDALLRERMLVKQFLEELESQYMLLRDKTETPYRAGQLHVIKSFKKYIEDKIL